MLLCAALGCGSEPVEARAIWVDGLAAEGTRRIHVYDAGDIYEFEVLGENDPQERVRLGPRGRGVLIRAQQRRGAWFDLDDGRRMPLLLPGAMAGDPGVNFAARGDALWWKDELDGSLRVLPLAPGLALERDDEGSMIPLEEPGQIDWALGSEDAPLLLVRVHDQGAALLRYPDEPRDALALAREAVDMTAQLPGTPKEAHGCMSTIDCYSNVSLAPGGERAIYQVGDDWAEFDARAASASGLLVLPEPLATSNIEGAAGVRLLKVLDRRHSAWVAAGQLHYWDQVTGAVDSVPLFAQLWRWFSADHGHAVVLLSPSGPMYRVDADGIEIVTLESTACNLAPGSEPVVSPGGRWAGWTCLDADGEIEATSGVVVRASANGLERHVGVPMSTLAIDDDGDLLIYSIESIFTDEVDGVAPTSRPRSLFSLSNGGVLSRIDELEPAPAPVLLGSSDIATYIQGAALD